MLGVVSMVPWVTLVGDEGTSIFAKSHCGAAFALSSWAGAWAVVVGL